MKTYSLIVTLAAAAATLLSFVTPAVAQEATYEQPKAVVVGKTRAEVVAELLAARAAGEPTVGEASFAFADGYGVPRRAAATAATAGSARTVKAVPRTRAERSTGNLEPHSFDGAATVADGAPAAAGTRSR